MFVMLRKLRFMLELTEFTQHFHYQVVPSLSRVHGWNRASPGSESRMGRRAVKPHSTASAVLRGS